MLIVPKAIHDNRLVNKTFLEGIITSFVALFLSILLSLPLEATIESGLPWNEVLSIQFLENIIVNTTFGQTWIFQAAILLTLGLITSFIWMAEATKRIILWVCFCLGQGYC